MDLSELILIAVIGVLLVMVWRKNQGTGANPVGELNKDISQLKGFVEGVTQSVNNLHRSVDQRLEESTKAIERSQRSIGERIDNSSRAYAEVRGQLEKLSEASNRIYDLGKDIASLQDTLKAPKLRGIWGELFLEEMLKDRFAKDQYQMQYKFKSGHTVDAVIFLRDKQIVPVDSKFSLENFKKLIEIDGEDKKEKVRKTFLNDVKKRIDEIAERYILPVEGTLNFALMYIPAENVYYEIMVRARETGPDIMAYALSKSVFPVSPNTLNIYLTTILSGLRGLEIEKRAQEMMAYLNSLNIDFDRFGQDYQLLGKHLTNAGRTFEEGEKHLGKLQNKLEVISGSGQAKLAE